MADKVWWVDFHDQMGTTNGIVVHARNAVLALDIACRELEPTEDEVRLTDRITISETAYDKAERAKELEANRAKEMDEFRKLLASNKAPQKRNWLLLDDYC
jgi:hypothetical protein